MVRALLIRGMLAGLLAGVFGFVFARQFGEGPVNTAIDFESYVEYTVHNTEPWKGRELVSSWYADGIVRWTLDAKGRGRQLGQFVPGHRPGMEALVWGVAPVPARNLVLLSDLPTGLWIVRPG